MARVINIDLGAENYVNPSEAIQESVFGAEFLGWEFFQNFEERHEEVEFHHIRWPGGIPVEDGINVDGSADGSREHVYDLRNDNLVDWDRADGTPREGIQEMMSYAVEHDVSLSMVAPTSRYVEQAMEDGEAAGLDAAREDMRYFMEKLLAGDYGEIPKDFTIELGSEYYSTDVWAKYTSDASGEPFSEDPGELPATFGKVFAVMADEIDEVLSDPELNPNGVDINIAVQLGRNGDDQGNEGTYSDNVDFIEAFFDVGSLDAVDSLIYHRYIPTFDNIGRGTEWNANGHNLDDAMQLWENAADKEFDLTAGYLSPSAQSPGKLEYNAPGLTNILQMNADLLAQGMDQGSIYALGHSTEGSLGWRDDVFIGGKLYEMMAESLPGMYLHDGFQDNTSTVANLGESYVASEDINSYVYENDESVVVFLSAKDFRGDELDYTLKFDEELTSGEVTRLWDSGETLNHAETGEVVGHYANTSEEPASIQTANGSSSVNVTFENDYEVIRLVLEKAPESIATPQSPPPPANDFAGTMGEDLIVGDAGDNKINGLDGKDTISGGAGNDTLKGGWGDDTIGGNPGNDRVSGDHGNDHLTGGYGDDTIFGGEGINILLGDPGNDYLEASGYADTLKGGEGNDTLVAGSDKTTIFFDATDPRVVSTERDEIYDFTLGKDFIELEGVDFGKKPGQISRGEFVKEHAKIEGNDVEITLDDGHKIVVKDIVKSNFKDPQVDDFYQLMFLDPSAQNAEDLHGTAGDDTLRGSEFIDRIEGHDGDDRIAGAQNADTLKGGHGDDTVFGLWGDDSLTGDWGDDKLIGGKGNDTLISGTGEDTLYGSMGDDFLQANGEKTILSGGAGNDSLLADSDETILRFGGTNGPDESEERDIVWKFDLGQDFIEIDGVEFGDEPGQVSREEFIKEHGEIVEDDLVITLEDGHEIVLADMVSDVFPDANLEDFYQVFAVASEGDGTGEGSLAAMLDDMMAPAPEEDGGAPEDDAGLLEWLIGMFNPDVAGYKPPVEEEEHDCPENETKVFDHWM